MARERGIFLFLQGHDCFRNAADFIVLQYALHRHKNCRPFDPMLSDSFSLAAQLSLRTAAFVVIMFDALCAAGAAFPDHQPFASSAEQLRCQQIFFRRFGFGGGFLLNAIRRCTRSNKSSSMIAGIPLGMITLPILVLADVLPVFEDQADPPILNALPFFFQPASVQRSRDLADALAAVITVNISVTSGAVRDRRQAHRLCLPHTPAAYFRR